MKVVDLRVDIGAGAVDDDVFAILWDQFLPVLHISNQWFASDLITKMRKAGTEQYQIAIRLRAGEFVYYYRWHA